MTDKRFEDIVAAALWLKNRSDCSGKIGVTGFCYGGSVSNQLAVRLGAVHGFFNDATPERYDEAAATAAWQRMVAWFNTHVRG